MVLNFRENNNLMQFTVSVPLHSLALQIFEQRQSRLTLKSVVLWTMGGKRVPVMNSDFVWTKCLKCLFLFTENILYEGPVSVWTEWITETQCEIVNKTESEQQPSVSRDHVQWFLKYYCNQPACVYFTKHHVSTSLFFFYRWPQIRQMTTILQGAWKRPWQKTKTCNRQGKHSQKRCHRLIASN